MARTPDKMTTEVVEQVRQIGTETGLLPDKRWGQLANELNRRGIQTSRGKTWTGITLRIFAERQGLIVTQTSHSVLEREKPGPIDRDVTQMQDTDTQPEKPESITQVPDRITHIEGPQDVLQVPDTVTQPGTQDSVPHAHTAEDTQIEVLQPSTSSHIPELQETVVPQHTLDPETVGGLREMLLWWKQRKDDLMPKPIEERPLFKRVPSATRSVRIGADLALDAERYALKHRAETGGSFSGLVELLLWERLGRRHKYLQPVPQANTQSDNAINDRKGP